MSTSTSAGVYYKTTWDRDKLPTILNLSTNESDSTPRLFDILVAGIGTGNIEADYDGNQVFDIDDVVEVAKLYAPGGMYKTPDTYFAAMQHHILAEGVEKFTVLIKQNGKTYTAEFYDDSAEYRLKALVLCSAVGELRNALHYADRIKLHHERLSNELSLVSELTDEILDFAHLWNLAEEPEWQRLEAKVSHIERTYVRL